MLVATAAAGSKMAAERDLSPFGKTSVGRHRSILKDTFFLFR